MGLTDAGAVAAASLIAGDGGVTAFNAANAYVGIGDSSTAFASSQTDLQASTNKTRKLVDTVVRTTNSVDYTSTFGTTQANYQWLEIAVFNASSGGTMLSRKVISLGIKPNTEQWSVTATVIYVAA
jgi:hypothetical protein